MGNIFPIKIEPESQTEVVFVFLCIFINYAQMNNVNVEHRARIFLAANLRLRISQIENNRKEKRRNFILRTLVVKQ